MSNFDLTTDVKVISTETAPTLLIFATLSKLLLFPQLKFLFDKLSLVCQSFVSHSIALYNRRCSLEQSIKLLRDMKAKGEFPKFAIKPPSLQALNTGRQSDTDDKLFQDLLASIQPDIVTVNTKLLDGLIEIREKQLEAIVQESTSTTLDADLLSATSEYTDILKDIRVQTNADDEVSALPCALPCLIKHFTFIASTDRDFAIVNANRKRSDHAAALQQAAIKKAERAAAIVEQRDSLSAADTVAALIDKKFDSFNSAFDKKLKVALANAKNGPPKAPSPQRGRSPKRSARPAKAAAAKPGNKTASPAAAKGKKTVKFSAAASKGRQKQRTAR